MCGLEMMEAEGAKGAFFLSNFSVLSSFLRFTLYALRFTREGVFA